MPKRDSTVRGREFGAAVREALSKANLTGRNASELAGWDPAKLSDLLNGKGGVNEFDVVRLLAACRIPPSELDTLLELFRETRQPALLQLHVHKKPTRLRTLMEHELTASEVIRWSMSLIPGQLQLPDYHRALIEVAPNVPPEETDARLAVRAEHQQKLLALRRKMTYFIHENALRLPVGGPEVTADQLHRVMDLGRRPYITCRIVPIAIGVHPGHAGSFTFLKFEKLGPLVYMNAETHGLFLEDDDTIKAHQNVLQALDRVALDEEESRELMTRLTQGQPS